jgi:hypothetical protein
MNAPRETTHEPHAPNDQSAVSSLTNVINVRFVPISSLQLQIKYAMKTPAPIQNKPILPSLFQIAAHLDRVIPSATSKTSLSLNQPSFASSMCHPEKLEAVSKTEARTTGQKPIKRLMQSARPSSGDGGGIGKPAGHYSPHELKKIEFFLKAPSAKSVKLAADFTDWEKCPLAMVRSGNGVWFSVVPLKPGQYSYRFIVDGRWCDDPRSTKHIPNPFGTENAVMVVT